jgi:hypothetical protein
MAPISTLRCSESIHYVSSKMEIAKDQAPWAEFANMSHAETLGVSWTHLRSQECLIPVF